jgi:hypothetical protein
VRRRSTAAVLAFGHTSVSDSEIAGVRRSRPDATLRRVTSRGEGRTVYAVSISMPSSVTTTVCSA